MRPRTHKQWDHFSWKLWRRCRKTNISSHRVSFKGGSELLTGLSNLMGNCLCKSLMCRMVMAVGPVVWLSSSQFERRTRNIVSLPKRVPYSQIYVVCRAGRECKEKRLDYPDCIQICRPIFHVEASEKVNLLLKAPQLSSTHKVRISTTSEGESKVVKG